MAEYLVRASSLEGLDDLVRDLGGDPDELRSAAGLPASPAAPDSWISYRAFLNLLELSAEALNCPHFGLLLSRQQGINILGSVGFVMREAPDVITALVELSKYFAHHNQGADVSLRIESGLAYWSFESKMPGSVPMRQQMDLVLGVGLNIMRMLCGARWNPRAAYLTHAAPHNRKPYQALFDCPIHFDAESCLMIFDAATLEMKMSEADDQLHKILEEHLTLVKQNYPNSYPDQIKHLIRQALLTGDCSADRVAAYLSTTKRTLQRRLKTESTSYKTLLEDVRLDMATRYLMDSRASLTNLADMLGYSELSAFSNAFKHQTGLSPREWRAQYTH
ncbi:MAG: AraC family transcriptional regulator [Candidatus Tectomicrobia bacterium]